MSTAPLTTRSTAQTIRTRQIAFALAIVVLFGLMWPYTEWLQRRKIEADLGEATIGQIDGGSFLLKLAMISGFRGPVANWLWLQADELKKQHEWDKLKATVDFITKLQPHFLSIWTYQGWNLAYNVSVEWDAPEDKYTWIKNGILFLRQGVDKNRKRPDLIWDTAWTYYNKLGMADEAIILRGLFYRDEDGPGESFKTDPISGERRDDNFQVAKGWFSRAVRLVDQGAERADVGLTSTVEYVDRMPDKKGRPGDINFRSMPAHSQTRYAVGLEKMSRRDVEPLFGEYAKEEWDRAFRDWVEFGTFSFPVPNDMPGLKERERVALDDWTNPEKFDSPELSENQRYWTRRFSSEQNYPYWKDRAAAEREEQGVEARRLFYEGTLAMRRANFQEAREKYAQGLRLWEELLERHPVYRDDEFNRKDTGEIVRRYVLALRQLGEPIPDDLPFRQIYEAVKDDPFRDPFDQLDVMKLPERLSKPASAGATPAAPPAVPGR